MKLRSRLRLNLWQKAICGIFFALFFSSSLNLDLSFADDISARAAVVIDESDGKILFAKNPDLKLPPASTTKLVAAMVALESISPGKIIVISKKAANTPSVSPHLKIGERYKAEDLLYLALMRSVNSAAVALAESSAGSEDAFVKLMNKKVSTLGAKNTRFANSSGLPGGVQHITAKDLALIMKEAVKNRLISEIINTKEKEIVSIDGRVMAIKNTNHLLWSDDGNMGGKTGYTRAAKHCFVCVSKKEQTSLIAVVLGEPIRERLWDTTSLLLLRGHDVLQNNYQPIVYFSDSDINNKPYLKASNKSKKAYRVHSASKNKAAKKANIAKGNVKSNGYKLAKKNKGHNSAQIKVAKKNGARKKSVS